ncbi:hypothetical protein AB1460_01160 [Parafrankia sp. FMc2]
MLRLPAVRRPGRVSRLWPTRDGVGARPGGIAGTLGSARFDAAVRDDAQGMLERTTAP